MPLLSAICPFCRRICSLGYPSFLPLLLSHRWESIRAEGQRLWLAHQPRLLQKLSANLAWFILSLAGREGTSTAACSWEHGWLWAVLCSAGAKLPSAFRIPLLLPVTCSVHTSLVSVVKTYRVVNLTTVLLHNHLVIRLLQYLCTVEGREEIQTTGILEECPTAILDVAGKW